MTVISGLRVGGREIRSSLLEEKWRGLMVLAKVGNLYSKNYIRFL